MGIGGQYAAINSAIDEMMPSKYRGRVGIWINGSYRAGAILGSFASLILLNAFAVNLGWRLAFLMGPVLALVVIVVARTLPESPRWLLTHGRVAEAEAGWPRSRRWPGARARSWPRFRHHLRGHGPGVLWGADRRRLQPHRPVHRLPVGAAIMIAGGIVELLIGINAEGKSLKDVTNPSPPPTPRP
jgi:MFS family permease